MLGNKLLVGFPPVSCRCNAQKYHTTTSYLCIIGLPTDQRWTARRPQGIVHCTNTLHVVQLQKHNNK